LKIGAEFLVIPLTWIINTSITTGKFPEEWKISKIIPLFKKGNRRTTKNYRPVALLSVAGMILERRVVIQIEELLKVMTFLDLSNLVSEKKKTQCQNW
jgi:hypothetical protein